MLDFFSQYPVYITGTFFSLLAGLATWLWASIIFFTRKISTKHQDIMMWFAAWVMLAATSFSLIVPWLQAAGWGVKAATIVVIWILLWAIFLDWVDKYLPHEHFIKWKEGSDIFKLRRLWLFIFAITIHNFPEWMAVWVWFWWGDISNGIALALWIGLQNIPEWLVVALALLSHKYSVKTSFFIALLTGLVEPLGWLLWAWIVSVFATILPWGLAFAAGAMLFVISDEIIPESHRDPNHARLVTYGLMIWFIIMLFLDVTLW